MVSHLYSSAFKTNSMETVLITGGTGLVGKRLITLLTERGYQIIVLTRNTNQNAENPLVSFANWDINNKHIDKEALSKANYIIHLAGAGVMDKKWTKAYQNEILESRTKSIELVIESLKNINHQVKALISASAIGWYGPDEKANYSFVEDDKPDENFLGTTCKLWEASADEAQKLGIRVCKMRIGIVLSDKGGALSEFMKPLKLGIAGILGNGKQNISWIHIEDLCRMFIHAMENQGMSGSYNAVAPYPTSNKTLTLTLARTMKGAFFIPFYVPSFLLKLMLGKRSIEILKSTKVSSAKISAQGFTFLYPSIEQALKNIIKK